MFWHTRPSTRGQLGISLDGLVPLAPAFSSRIVPTHCVLLRVVNYQKSGTEMECNEPRDCCHAILRAALEMERADGTKLDEARGTRDYHATPCESSDGRLPAGVCLRDHRRAGGGTRRLITKQKIFRIEFSRLISDVSLQVLSCSLLTFKIVPVFLLVCFFVSVKVLYYFFFFFLDLNMKYT